MKLLSRGLCLMALVLWFVSGQSQEAKVDKPPGENKSQEGLNSEKKEGLIPDAKGEPVSEKKDEPNAEKKVALPAETKDEPSSENEGDIISLINLVDASMLGAIDHLVKLAGLNVFVDPKISSPTPVIGADGKPLPQPTITLKFEKVTAENALEALLINNDLVMIRDQKTQIHRIMKRDPTVKEPLVLTVYHLKFASATNIASVMLAALPPGAKVLAENRTSQVIISATMRDTADITNLLIRLDIATKQILIEAQFYETLRNPRTIKGMDWSGTLANQTLTMGNGLSSGSSTTTTPGNSTTTTLPSGRTITSSQNSSKESSITTLIGDRNLPGMSFNTATGLTPGLAFLNADGVKATLSFLNTDSDSDSIASPTAVALEGQQTKLVVVRNIPVFEEQQGAAVAGSQSPTSVKPNYSLKVEGSQADERPLNEVGIKLLVTPRVVNDTSVLLDLQPEISTVEGLPERKVLGGRINESPIFSRRLVTTRAIVPSASTLVLGGLSSDESAKNFVKVPILGDIPLLGRLFRKDEKIRNKRNMLIFVTPTIIQDEDLQQNPDSKAILRSKKEDKLPDDLGRWDSAKPYKSKSSVAPKQ